MSVIIYIVDIIESTWHTLFLLVSYILDIVTSFWFILLIISVGIILFIRHTKKEEKNHAIVRSIVQSKFVKMLPMIIGALPIVFVLLSFVLAKILILFGIICDPVRAGTMGAVPNSCPDTIENLLGAMALSHWFLIISIPAAVILTIILTIITKIVSPKDTI